MSHTTGDSGRADLSSRGLPLQIEYRFIGGVPSDAAAPCIVFLHEGLGSVALWRDFPDRLCAAAGCTGLVYSRPGYGRSTPRPAASRWTPSFLHEQAGVVLPAVLDALRIDVRRRPPWLFGHSDGGSIALLHAALRPGEQVGVVALAPHVFVETFGLEAIAAARDAYSQGELRAKLARYHDDVDSAFLGWNDIWLDPAFRTWNIVSLLGHIRVPVLAVQGHDDEYGTMAQIEVIGAHVRGCELLRLERCGHSPQRDRPDALIDAAVRFIDRRQATDNDNDTT